VKVISAVATLKGELARQYALAADHNRQINKRRERRRSIAGLAALGSVLTTVFLVGATYAHYLSVRVEKDLANVAPPALTPASHGGELGHHSPGWPGLPPATATAPNASRH
jgi:hypothetical protein